MKRGKVVVALLSLLSATVLTSSYATAACEKPIDVTVKDGRQVAHFQVGDARCRLSNEQVYCTPVSQ